MADVVDAHTHTHTHTHTHFVNCVHTTQLCTVEAPAILMKILLIKMLENVPSGDEPYNVTCFDAMNSQSAHRHVHATYVTEFM